MALTQAECMAKLKIYACWTDEPVLTQDALNTILADNRIEDAAGLLPGQDDYTETYDLDNAIADAWALKASKSVGHYDYEDEGAKYKRSQIYDHCIKQEQRYRNTGGLQSVMVERDDNGYNDTEDELYI